MAEPMQTIGGTGFPARCFAYVPDPEKPSTWKLRMYRNPGDAQPDSTYVGACIAALGPGGFRGNRVQIPQSDLGAVKAKVSAAWKKLHPDEKSVPSAIA